MLFVKKVRKINYESEEIFNIYDHSLREEPRYRIIDPEPRVSACISHGFDNRLACIDDVCILLIFATQRKEYMHQYLLLTVAMSDDSIESARSSRSRAMVCVSPNGIRTLVEDHFEPSVQYQGANTLVMKTTPERMFSTTVNNIIRNWHVK